MKIMFVINSLNVGGAEQMLAKIAKNIAFADDDITVVTLIGNGILAEEFVGENHCVISLGLSRNPLTWLNIVKLAVIMRRRQPDVVHSWLYQSDIVAGIVTRFVTNCAVIWSLRQSNLAKEHNKFTTRLCIKLCALMSRYLPDAIVSNAYIAMLAHTKIGYAANKIVIIPNGFDLSQSSRDASAAAKIREELGIGHDAPMVSMIGRFDSQKNHVGFFRAMRTILNALPDTNFCFAGVGVTTDNPAINKMIYENNIDKKRLHLLGQRNDINAVMSATDLLALPSDGEAFPNVVGEAMACEIPCVVTDVGDCGEIVGKTGRVVPAGDMLKFADEVIGMLSKSKLQRQAMGREARLRVKARYDIDKVAKAYRDLYVRHSCSASG